MSNLMKLMKTQVLSSGRHGQNFSNFASADTSMDGEIDFKEFKNIPMFKTMGRFLGDKPAFHEFLAKQFERLDRNKDGSISRAEFKYFDISPTAKQEFGSTVGPTFLCWMALLKLMYGDEKEQAQVMEGRISDFSNREVQQHLPPIDVAVKIYSLSNISTRTNTFEADFNVMMDWEDPSLHLATPGEVFKIENHFCPQYKVTNISPQFEHSKSARPPRHDDSRKPCRVKWTRRFKATLKTQMDPTRFPFDVQILSIIIKPDSVDSGRFHCDKKAYRHITPELLHPVRWRRTEGHVIDKNADWMSDFALISLNGIRNGPTYKVLIGVEREYCGVVTEVFLMMAIICLISLTCYFQDLASGIATIVTAMLTMIAFKWSLQEKLPSMSGLSYVELTMCMCVVVFLFQAVLITLRDLYLYRYGMGHPEDDTSYCRVLFGGLIWWMDRTDINFTKKPELQWTDLEFRENKINLQDNTKGLVKYELDADSIYQVCYVAGMIDLFGISLSILGFLGISIKLVCQLCHVTDLSRHLRVWGDDNFKRSKVEKKTRYVRPRERTTVKRPASCTVVEKRTRQYDPFQASDNLLASEYQSEKIQLFYKMYWEMKNDGQTPGLTRKFSKNRDLDSHIRSGISSSSIKDEWSMGLEVISKPYKKYSNPKQIPAYKEPECCLHGCGDTSETGAVCKCGSEGKLHCLHPRNYLIGAEYIFHARSEGPEVVGDRNQVSNLKLAFHAKQESEIASIYPFLSSSLEYSRKKK